MEKQIYKNRKIVLLTKHQKEEAIRPILEEATGCTIIVESSFDTDKFGTFSRDITRTKSQLETARLKIKEGMLLTGLEIGIASEGSFGSHPFIPAPWNIELVLLIDQQENFELYGIHESGETNFAQLTTASFNEAVNFAKKIGFPEHFLIIRPDDSEAAQMIKGINNCDWLEEAFALSTANSHSGKVFIETDMRAHANPTRMGNIRKATADLISKLHNFCPNCAAPGFIVSERIQGLPCELCGLPSDLVLKNISKCYKCSHVLERLHPNGQFAAAQYCHFCNP
ncbi:MAG: hypothetical protein KGZ41_01785 [Dethiobacter sp.]|jgi:hypothetical protein|nr:hypothetical protein [Dethiobacter sp.]MBS3982510.1 hypothetical protein [Dethiobacter sp.]MCL4463243.1 hypothetical protein [Bacillota bacterium]MCL5992992.1 hypothetical protein [Bacillota bacterium]